jgi:phenylalanyl-tRNA synthetase alpha chain
MSADKSNEMTDSRVATVAQEVATVAATALDQISRASAPEDLEKLRVTYLGKHSKIMLLSKELGKVPAELRPALGQAINAGKDRLQEALCERKAALESAGRRPKSALDVTLPGIRKGVGRRHPLTQTMEGVKSVLQGMGFRYDDYPEVETAYYNFDALNTPEWHPSRDMHDSFYTKAGGVLRTHTSAFQVRAMRHLKEPPIRAMTSGRCYRRDEIDATHFPIFHQVDVIAIDRSIRFADLKWTLDRMLRALLGHDIKLRFRPSFFPFTTPSAEVDAFYRGRWMELLGSGMIRPEVLRNGGLDPEEYQGFAFGMGIDRLTMARFGIDDIRLLYANEESFLAQF